MWAWGPLCQSAVLLGASRAGRPRVAVNVRPGPAPPYPRPPNLRDGTRKPASTVIWTNDWLLRGA
jgi:hypothetical protein